MRFFGAESTSQSPFMRLRLGRVREVYYSRDTAPSESNKSLDQTLGSIKVDWLDWEGGRDFVRITFPFYSNPVEVRDEDTKIGKWYGDISLPSVGDVVLIGFRDDHSAVMLSYLPHNYHQQSRTGSKSSEWGTARAIEPGEMSRKSKQQAEIYQDKTGAVQVIVKSQPVSGSVLTDGSATAKAADIDPTEVPSTELARVTIGETYTDETFANRKTSENSSKKLVASVAMTSGARIDIDTDGNIDITPATNKSVNINKGTKGVARLDDAVKSTSDEDSAFWSFISSIVSVFNAHTHTGVTPGGGASGPPATPLSSAPDSMTGKITESSTNVKAGD